MTINPAADAEATGHLAGDGTRADRRLPILIAIGLALLVAAVYWGSGSHEFVDFDDGEYVYDNPHVKAGLTAAGIRWALTSSDAANWHPVAWLSHMADVQLFGMNAGRHHQVNVAFHVVNTLLLFWLLRKVTGATGRSAFAAVLFGVHPLHVESVAWVAERKDVLSTFFMLLTMMTYAAYVRRPSRGRYAAALLLFALGLMSKSMLVTLPFALLLLDFWPLGRFPREGAAGGRSVRRIVLEKVPFLFLSILASLATFLAQSHSGATAAVESFPPGQRIANAFVACVFYLKKTLWPTALAVFYPHPVTLGQRIPAASWIPAAAILVLISAFVVRERRRRPYLPFGWLWFLVTLSPVIGIVQVGSQAMADRYTYVPLVGIFVAMAWGTGELLERLRVPRAACAVLGAAFLVPLSIAAHAQSDHWADGTRLYRHALAVTRGNWLAWNNLGMQFLAASDDTRAAGAFHEAVTIKPDYAIGWYNLGVASGKLGRHPEAAACYRRSLELDPSNADGWGNLAFEHLTLRNPAAAIAAAEEALRQRPDDVVSLTNLLVAQWAMGDAPSARRSFDRLKAVDSAAAMSLASRVGLPFR